MKKILSSLLGISLLTVSLASCGNTNEDSKVYQSKIETIPEKFTSTISPSTTPSTPSTMPSAPSTTLSTPSTTTPETNQPIVDEFKKTQTTAYLVGDSTVCSFNDTSYYYPRYGYGTQMSNYFDSLVTFNNLALSGRSSKSFITESNYTTLKNNIKSGDYLIIGFGHNDEKNDDAVRYSDPNGSVNDEGSFKYNLYNYYIKLAKDKGATPILCTPICRADTSNNYTTTSAHITSTGDYPKTIRELGTETNTEVIDLTNVTKALYGSMDFNSVINYHAWTSSNSASVDKTHLNIYGAKTVAYNFAKELGKSNCTLKHYVLDDITAPTKEKDLVSNPAYVESTYTTFTESMKSTYFTQFTTTGWYGTAFGDTGGAVTSSRYMAKENADGTFSVGQQAAVKGKIAGSSEGIAMIFKQVSISKNFKLTCDVTVKEKATTTSDGFGLMLRDDIHIDERDASILSNYVTAGMYTTSSGSEVIYSRENTVLSKGVQTAATYAVGDTASLSIERIGQAVNVSVVYKGQTYTKTYTDFDFVAVDNNYMYIGMYATRGTVINCNNVLFTITGDAIAA